MASSTGKDRFSTGRTSSSAGTEGFTADRVRSSTGEETFSTGRVASSIGAARTLEMLQIKVATTKKITVKWAGKNILKLGRGEMWGINTWLRETEQNARVDKRKIMRAS